MLKVGKVYSNGKTATLVISNLDDLINVLFPILNEYNLLTTKYLDFLDFLPIKWYECLLLTTVQYLTHRL